MSQDDWDERRPWLTDEAWVAAAMPSPHAAFFKFVHDPDLGAITSCWVDGELVSTASDKDGPL